MIHRSVSIWTFCLTLLIAAAWSPVAQAAPHSKCRRHTKRAGYTLLGWKGLRAGINVKDYEKVPKTSGGGELGDVLYIADGTDLARSFAHTHVCEIYAESSAWRRMPKAWVSQEQIHHGVDAHVFPGAALFASHTAAGLHGDHEPWQLGVRGPDLRRLGVGAKCYPLDHPCVSPGIKLYYDRLTAPWDIHGHPERGH